jgi:L-aspartate oxidase
LQSGEADFLIIGSGIAALRAALALADAGNVLMLTKAGAQEGNTGYAQGGIAAAVGPGDSPARHLADTLAAGDGLCDERAVAALVEDGPRYVQELLDWGARFDRDPDGTPSLAIEGAHSVRRVLHAHDATGREIGRVLWERVSRLPNVRVLAHERAVSAIVEDGRVAGVRFLERDGTVSMARAASTLLATGGAGQVYRETTNPPVATGDGVAIAYAAGAAVADLEFVQFHPTALKMPGQPRFLLSEALRGEGGRLVNGFGEAFMTRVDPMGDLAPRDRVSRAIAREAERTGADVYLTLDRLDPSYVHERFPLISEACRRAGLDLAMDRIPIGPAAHYMMGGVVTDLDGRTSIPGLFAAGEVACTGVHGANRLASNSLLEGLVFGARGGRAMAKGDSRLPSQEKRTTALERTASRGKAIGFDDVRDLMWRKVGLFRDAAGLAEAVDRLEDAWSHIIARIESDSRSMTPDDWDAASVIIVGRLIARAAQRRQESRGGHFRLDYPARDDSHWKRRITETRESRDYAEGHAE